MLSREQKLLLLTKFSKNEKLDYEMANIENSKTSVVCVKVGHIRPKYSNLKEWMKNDNNIYIGRKGIVFIKDEEGNNSRYPKNDSIWHNPFKITKDSTRTIVLDSYEKYLDKKLKEKPELINDLLKLKGKTLGCWCHPEPCHGDVLVKYIEKYSN